MLLKYQGTELTLPAGTLTIGDNYMMQNSGCLRAAFLPHMASGEQCHTAEHHDRF